MQNYGFSGGMNSRPGGNLRSGGTMNYGPRSRGMYDQDDGFGMDNNMNGGNSFGRYGGGNDNFPSMNRGRFNQMDSNMYDDDDMYMDSMQGPPNRNQMSSNQRFDSDFYNNGPQRGNFGRGDMDDMSSPRMRQTNQMRGGNWNNEGFNFGQGMGRMRNQGSNFRSDAARRVLPQSRPSFRAGRNQQRKRGRKAGVSRQLQKQTEEKKPNDGTKTTAGKATKANDKGGSQARSVMSNLDRDNRGKVILSEKMMKKYITAASLLSEHLILSNPKMVKQRRYTHCSVCNMAHNSTALHRWSIRHQTCVFYENFIHKGGKLSSEQEKELEAITNAAFLVKKEDKPNRQPGDEAEKVASDAKTSTSDAKMAAGDAETAPSDSGTAAVDSGTATSDAETAAGDAEAAAASDAEAVAASDAEAVAGDVEMAAGDAETTAVDAEATPVDAEATPVDAEATPVDAEATAGDAEATSGDAEMTAGDSNNLAVTTNDSGPQLAEIQTKESDVNGEPADGDKSKKARRKEKACFPQIIEFCDELKPVGEELVLPISGLFCRLCKVFISSNGHDLHCKSRRHRLIYLKREERRHARQEKLDKEKTETASKEREDGNTTSEDKKEAVDDLLSAVEEKWDDDGDLLGDDSKPAAVESAEAS